MSNKVIAYTTCLDRVEAEKIATHLIEKQFAACVNILPSTKSFYKWQGVIETNDEALMMIKTSRDLIHKVQQVIKQIHSYELPELIVVPIIDGSPDYLAWIEHELKTT